MEQSESSTDTNNSKDDQIETMTESSNPNLTSMDASDKEKIKGDAIGETMYSERFVLQTMLTLLENKWNEEIETDLCTLWDMTTEKDVILFLLKSDFIRLSLTVIKKTEEIRLTEIMVGIVGNMCCFPEACKEVYNCEYDIYISLTKVADTPLLVQLMRLFKGLLYDNDDNQIDLVINETVIEQINFILSSSQNSELLIYTLQVLSKIIERKKLDILSKYDLLSNVNESFNQLLKNISTDIDLTGFLSHEHEKIITAYLNVLQNINLSFDETNEKNSQAFSFLQNNVDETLSHLETILSLCCDVDVFNAMTKNISFYIYCIVHFTILLKPPFCLKILEHLIIIFDIILTEKLDLDADVMEETVNLICFMINKGNIDVLRKLFKTWPKEKIVFLLKDNIMDKTKCDDDFIDKFNNLCYM